MSDLTENLKSPDALENADGQDGDSVAPHVPVLLAEVLAALRPEPGKLYVDATLGAGGHSEAILQRLTEEQTAPEASKPSLQLIGIDQDPTALTIARERLARFGGRAQLVQGNFSQIAALVSPLVRGPFKNGALSPEIATDAARPRNDSHVPTGLGTGLITGGVLADIGVSSMQLDQAERGFSFAKPAPLDMRMAPEAEKTATDVVNTYPEAELLRIFSEYGEEHLSKTLARAIVERRRERRIETTTDLADCIAAIYRQRGKHEKIHPATRVFQALRIEVNDELGSLQRFLAQLPALLAPGARIAVITFHSLEDRIVKRFLQDESRDCLCPPRLPVCQCGHRATLKLVASKPVTATQDEIRRNPRARSAKLRVAERL